VHVCAILGLVPLITYFLKEVHLSASEPDINGRTPLHLAALEGQETIGGLLIAWTPQLDERDKEGYTPLHLAAYSNNYRIVRYLLMKGARREAVDSHGSTPLDIAKIRSAHDLIPILVKPFFLQKMNPCKSTLEPVKNSYTRFIIYIALFMFRYALIFLFLFPDYPFEFGICSLLLFCLTLFFFISVSKKDPGFIQPNPDMGFLDLYEKYLPEYVCPYCEVKRPKHSRHCQHCNRCVRKFDHHCPWIHNCVGEKNFKVFFAFIIVCLVDFLYHFTLGILDCLDLLYIGRKPLVRHLIPVSLTGAIMIVVLCGISLLMIVPVAYVQITNVIKNKTTRERFAYKPGERERAYSVAESNASDRASMLLDQDDSDWGNLGITLLSSISLSEAPETTQSGSKDCFCIKKTKTAKHEAKSLSTVKGSF